MHQIPILTRGSCSHLVPFHPLSGSPRSLDTHCRLNDVPHLAARTLIVRKPGRRELQLDRL